MPMHLPPDLDQSVRRHISSGQFSSAKDVLRAAIHQLDEMHLLSLRQSAEDDEAGRLVSLQAAATTIRKKHGFDELQRLRMDSVLN